MRLSKKLAALAVGTIATVAVAGGAYAYWTTAGGGTGSGSAKANFDSTLVVHLTAPAALTPGGSVDLAGTVSNPNGGSAYAGHVTASVDTFSIGASGTPCTQADFNVSGTSTVVGTIAANGSNPWSGLKLNMADGSGNQDNCKGVTVPLTLTIDNS